MVFTASKRALSARAAETPIENGREGTRAKVLANAIMPRSTAQEYAREIGLLWGEAQEKFLAIGKYLRQAKAGLPHGDWERLVSHMLPFGRAVAHKLRVVAEAVEEKRLAEETLPRSYANAYELAALEGHELALAAKRQLVRPDVTRREIDAFKRELKLPADEAERASQRRAELLRRRKRLMEELAQIESELSREERGVAEINSSAEPFGLPEEAPEGQEMGMARPL
ncbi:conserved protein of unknown function (plasmid) [Rhodovastum atsumiense]|nr:conserved protein of unknown function [Rhodovastum atsumiense]